MASKTPIKATFSGSDVSGLAEYTASDFISLADGGLGASLTIGSVGQVLKVNSSANALEFGSVEAIVNIDGATDLESATLAVGDKILLSDGGTEGRVLLSQLDTLFSGTSKTLTNKTINSNANTLHIDLDDLGTFTGSLAEFNAGLQGDSFVSLTGTETLTNKTLTSPVLNTGVSGSAVLDEDNFASNSATKLATQQSIKTYVDSQAHLSLIDEDDMSSDSATRPPSQQSVKAYVDAQEHAVTATSTTTFTNKTLTSPVLNTGVSGSAILDEDAMGSNSATQLATQQSIKAYVDAQVTAQDLDFQGDSGGALSIDFDSETLDIAGGTGIDTVGSSNTLTVAIDSTVSTLTGTQTLTNKTLTTPTITTPIINTGASLKNGSSSAGYADFYEDSDNGTNYARLIGPASTATVTLTLPAATDTLVGKATTDTLTNKSIDLGDNTLTGSLAEFNTALQSDSFVSLTGTETLTNKTLTSAVLNTGVSGSAIKDEDNMASDSATHLATQQSIKKYVDDSILTKDNTDEITEGSTNLYFTDARADARITNALIDEDNMASDSATKLPSQQSVKAYVDTQVATVPTGDITSVVAGTGLTGGGTSGDATLNVIGGTGITANADDIAIDSTVVATLTGSQILTSKTIDSASNTLTLDLGEGTLTGTTAEFNSALQDGSFTTLAGTETLTNKTLTAPKIADDGFIADASGNEQILFQTTASAVNYLEVTNSAAGNGFKVGTAGGDTNIDLILDPKGSGVVDVNSSRITNVTDPSGAQDAATKAYVDATANGLDVKDSAKLATTAALSACTYNNGNGTLTADANGALSVDGVAVAVNDRILVKNQASAVQNGLYKVTATGSGGAAFVLTRTPDADAASEITGGAFVFVESGTANADNGYVFTHDGTPTLGSTNITVSQFSGAGQISAGDALIKSGNTLDVVADDSTLEISSDAVQIKTTYPGQTSITTLGTIATGTWNGTAIGNIYGGTGQTTYTTGDMLYASGSNTLAKLALGASGKLLQSNGSNIVYADVDGGTY